MLSLSLSACAGAVPATSPQPTGISAESPTTAGPSLPGSQPKPEPDPPASPSIVSAAPDPTPGGHGLSVRWQPAELEEAGLDRVSISGIVGVPGGGYLASGHGYTPAGGYLGELFWRSDDGRVWERSDVSGPSGVGTADSGPLGIVAVDGGGPWWSPDGVGWTKGDLEVRGDPRLWEVAVGDQAAVIISSEGAWASTDGLRWEPVTGERVEASRLYGVTATQDGFIAVGNEWTASPEEWPEGDYEARVWRISPDGATWRLDRGGDLSGRTFDTLTDAWAFGDTALAIGTHGEADAYHECIRLYGGDCGTQWGVETAYRSVDGAPWQREYAVEEVGGEQPRLSFARGGADIEPWRDGLLALGLDGESPLALHASTDGLTWERSSPRKQLPELGHGFIGTFFVDGDLAIVSGTVEPIGDDSDQEYFLQVGTITP